jgi:hypothetical protein
MFLRVTRTVSWQTIWKVIMYFSIFYHFLTASIILVLQLTECQPLRFFWDRSVEGGHCRSPKQVRDAIIGTQVVFALSDFQFSLLPLTFICTLNRSLRERVAVTGLMGVGLVASTVGCLKFIGFNKLHANPDPTYIMVPWKLASFAEASIGIIAANLPPLKSKGEELINKARSGTSLFSVSRSSRAASVRKTRSLSDPVWEPCSKRTSENQDEEHVE